MDGRKSKHEAHNTIEYSRTEMLEKDVSEHNQGLSHGSARRMQRVNKTRYFLTSLPFLILCLSLGCETYITELPNTKLIHSKHFVVEYSLYYEGSVAEFICMAESTFKELKGVFGKAPKKRIRCSFLTVYDGYRLGRPGGGTTTPEGRFYRET